MAQVFLASVGQDLQYGRSVSERLKGLGAHPVPGYYDLLAVDDFGSHGSVDFASAIERCVSLVAFISENAMGSGWWHDSLHYAYGNNIPVYPVAVDRSAPKWLAPDGKSVQATVKMPAGGYPPAAWFSAVASGRPWPNPEGDDDVVVFRVHATLAWPIWAGGYPSQNDALARVDESMTKLKADFGDILGRAVGADYQVREIWSSIGGYQPIPNLYPGRPQGNSINVDLSVRAKWSKLQPREKMEDQIKRICNDFEGVVAVFARTSMPGAQRGANIYDVSTTWDAAEGMTAVRPVEDVPQLPPLSASAIVSAAQRANVVFVSYSRRDQRWLTRLQVHLAPLTQQSIVNVWDDTKLKGGENWRPEIEAAIESCRVAVLLVSADFMASEFIVNKELPPLLRRASQEGAVILPVIIGHSSFSNSELNDFQAANSPDRPLQGLPRAKQDFILNQVANRIRAIMAD